MLDDYLSSYERILEKSGTFSMDVKRKHKLCIEIYKTLTLRERCPYSEFFWSVFSLIRTEYGEILCISPFSVRMPENTDQKNSKYGPFLHSVNNLNPSFMKEIFELRLCSRPARE